MRDVCGAAMHYLTMCAHADCGQGATFKVIVSPLARDEYMQEPVGLCAVFTDDTVRQCSLHAG